jgi:predicted nucleic acid-binding protein
VVADLAALLDASVIVPASLNDTLLLAAEAGLYRVHWSADILDEVQRTLISDGMATFDQAAKRLAAMRHAFPGAMVVEYQAMIDQMTNHPKDRHVAAAAVAAGANVIVTSNLRDFPQASLVPYGILAKSPDDFLIDLDDSAPALLTRIVVRQAAGLRRPPASPEEVLDHLSLHAPLFAARLLARF